MIWCLSKKNNLVSLHTSSAINHCRKQTISPAQSRLVAMNISCKTCHDLHNLYHIDSSSQQNVEESEGLTQTLQSTCHSMVVCGIRGPGCQDKGSSETGHEEQEDDKQQPARKQQIRHTNNSSKKVPTYLPVKILIVGCLPSVVDHSSKAWMRFQFLRQRQSL